MRISGLFLYHFTIRQNPLETPLHSAKVCKKCVKK